MATKNTFRKKFACNIVVFSPSRRTASSIVTDCQSEAFGLIVIINRTGHPILTRVRQFVVSSLTSLDRAKIPMYRAFEIGEVHWGYLT